VWAELTALLAEFDSAVLTARDDAGYPSSLRCQPRPDRAAQILRLELGPASTLRAGPASLLCHRHDAQLWNQKVFLARGRLEQDQQGWLFRPTGLVPGAGIGGLVGLVRFIIGSRRAASRYLARRGLARPAIPWSEIQAVKQQVEREEPASGRS
jgi:hypothetical protein